MDEVELKFRVAGPAEQERLRGLLAARGARHEATAHEENRLYADPTGRLQATGDVLRLRLLDGGPRATLTYKGPARFDGAVKSRHEIEVEVGDGARMHALLEALGYRVALVYEKDRETWRLGEVEVALDTLVFGHFCELEGPAAAISALARDLGLDESQAETSGYPALAERQKAKGKRQK